MINAQTLVIWIFFSNLISISLLVIALRKIQDKILKYHFVFVIIAGLSYIDPLLLFWLPDISEDTRFQISRFVFTGGLFLAQAFVLFIVRFCRIADELKSIRYWLFALDNISLIVLVWIGELPVGIKQNGSEYSLVHGAAQPFLVLSTCGYATYFGFLAWRGYKRAQDEVLQYQIKILMSAGVLTAIAMVITNSIIPYLTRRSTYAPFVAVEATLFWSVALYILIRGEVMILRSEFSSLIARNAFGNYETFSAMRTYLDVFETSLEVDRPIEEKINFFTEARRAVKLRVTNLTDSNALTGESVPFGWYEGQTDEILRLRSENFRLTVAVQKSRELLGLAGSDPQVAQIKGPESNVEETGQLSPVLQSLSPLELSERETILKYLKRNQYNQARASKELGIRPNTLIVKMRKYDIRTERGRGRPRKRRENSASNFLEDNRTE